MSRVGNLPVAIPAGVTVDVRTDELAVKGPKGALAQALVQHVAVAVQDGQVVVQRSGDSRQARANHGLMRALVQNMVTGVTDGFTKELEIVGVGYRAERKGGKLVLQLGYSHPVEYDVPKDVDIQVDRNVNIKVSGADKQQVGQVAAVIRSFRKPDHYKGKGIRYKGEWIRIKTGKSA